MRAEASTPPIRLGLEVWGELRRSNITTAAVAAALAFGLAAVLGPLIAPQDPADPAALDLSNGCIPPLWLAGGRFPFWLGTDEQGREALVGFRGGGLVSYATKA